MGDSADAAELLRRWGGGGGGGAEDADISEALANTEKALEVEGTTVGGGDDASEDVAV